MSSVQDRVISESEFVEAWGAHVSDSGDLYAFEDVSALPIETVWTVVECDDDSWIAIAGFHVVNRWLRRHNSAMADRD